MLVGSAAELVRRSVEFSTVRLSCRRYIERSVTSAGFKRVEALGRIVVRGPYPPSNAIIYMHLQLQ